MKTKWQKLAALGLAILMMFSLAAIPAFADDPTVTSATEMDASYYNLQGNGSLTLLKYQKTSDSYQTTDKPIDNVKFKYVKVGGLYELKVKNAGETLENTVMAYGVTQGFATAVGLTNPDYTYTDSTSSTTTWFFLDGNSIQTAANGKTANELTNFLTQANATEVTTGEEGTPGQVVINNLEYGLYLVVETDVSGATIDSDKIAITQVQAPFIVSLPTAEVTSGNTVWNKDITAYVKNSTGTADVEKKIVVGDGTTASEQITNGSEAVDDTDITHIGDTVYFRLMGTVPAIPSNSSIEIENYVLTDQISKGLTYGNITHVRDTNGETYAVGTDFNVSALGDVSSADVFDGGKLFTITFTEAGKTKLTNLAKSTVTNKQVYVYYSATVNENAVIGTGTDNSGNPNQVMLTYKTTGGNDIGTGWDKVTHFTFGVDVTKQFQNDGTAQPDATKVTFKIYTLGTDGTTKTYYSFLGSNGVYHTPSAAVDEAAATALKLDASKQISIKGLDEGTYYIEETATAPGYNLLKSAVEVKIDPNKGQNNFVGNNNQYLGTFQFNQQPVNTAGITVVNTQGFTLPTTGGAGIWMFVLGGAVVIALGFGYFMMSRKKEK